MPDQLDLYMKAGIKAAAYTRKKVPKSSNYKYTSSRIWVDDPLGDWASTKDKTKRYSLMPAFNDKAGAVGDMRTEFRDEAAGKKGWERIVATAKKAEQKGVGNCGELGAVATRYLYEEMGIGSVDLLRVTDGRKGGPVIPHVLVAVGRQKDGDPGENIGRPNSWGRHAVICDPWDRVVYPAAQFMTFWGGLIQAAGGNVESLWCEIKIRPPGKKK